MLRKHCKEILLFSSVNVSLSQSSFKPMDDVQPKDLINFLTVKIHSFSQHKVISNYNLERIRYKINQKQKHATHHKHNKPQGVQLFRKETCHHMKGKNSYSTENRTKLYGSVICVFE